MNTSKKSLLLTMSTLVVMITGCSSNPKFSCDIAARRVTILTEPEGATITQINPAGQPSSNLGTSPVNDRSVMIVTKITKARNLSYHTTKSLMEQVGNVVVLITKEGYQTYRGTLKTEPGKTAVHEIKLQPKNPASVTKSK